MRTRTKAGVIAGALVATAATGTGVAVATGGEDSGPDVSITGTDLDRASSAALDSTGEGKGESSWDPQWLSNTRTTWRAAYQTSWS